MLSVPPVKGVAKPITWLELNLSAYQYQGERVRAIFDIAHSMLDLTGASLCPVQFLPPQYRIARPVHLQRGHRL